ncbi:MAG: aminoacyl-tRNA hydrolase [Crenarchaeota archaeon]|nr:MAG: aminoacyl-tRNA hydrolase [Thermoproteota archaeon]
MKTKQVIVVRRWYQDAQGRMFSLRAGKFIAQASHASMAFLTKRLAQLTENDYKITLSEVEQAWLNSSFAKVVVRVNSEEELLEIERKAKEAGLECNVVTDSGRTEFKGIPTKTCLAIGPDIADKIDSITANLELY